MTWAGKLQTINDGMRTASTKTRRKTQKKNDGVMRKIIKELLAIEEEQAQAQRKFGGAQQRHSWSDVFARRNSIHRLLVDIVKKVVKKSLRPKICNIVKSLTKTSKLLHLDVHEVLQKIPPPRGGRKRLEEL